MKPDPRCRRSRCRSWWWCIGAITLLRLALCARDEITALDGDASNYARLAVFYLTGHAQDVLPDQRPGIAILAKCSTALGLPYKLFLDGLFLFAAYLAARLIRRVTQSSACGIVTYALLAMSPWFMKRSEDFLSEPVMSVLLLLLFCSTAPLLFLPPRCWTARSVLPAGLISAACILVRPENPVLYGYWLLVAIVAAWRHRHMRLAILVVPVVMVLATTMLFQQVHRMFYGVAALSKTESRGEHALLDALYAIQPHEEIRFAPVTLQTLDAACGQSVTLNRHRDELVDPGGTFVQVAKANINLEGEVGPWLNWHLVKCFGGVNELSNEEMMLAAREIRAALDDGRLPRRRAGFPVDPLWNEWMRDLPRECCNAVRNSLRTPYLDRNPKHDARRENATAVTHGMLDNGLLRRRGTRSVTELRISGHASAATSSFQIVRVLAPDHRVLGVAPIAPNGPEGARIEFTAGNVNLGPGDHVFMEFNSDDSAVPASSLPIHLASQWTYLEVPRSTNDGPETWMTVASVTPPRNAWQTCLRNAIFSHYLHVLGIVVVGFFGVGLCSRRNPRAARNMAALLLAGWGLFFGRSLLYALVEAWLHWGLRRYVGANCLLTVTLLVWTAFVLGLAARRMLQPSTATGRPRS